MVGYRMKLTLIALAFAFVGCSDVRFDPKNISTMCPKNAFMSGLNGVILDYGAHRFNCEYDSLGNLTLVCSLCGYREKLVESK